jgi:hypothetical protein
LVDSVCQMNPKNNGFKQTIPELFGWRFCFIVRWDHAWG